MRTLWKKVGALVARLRGIPPPITAEDVAQAQRDLESATPADRAAGREAARRALAALDGTESALPPTSDSKSPDQDH
jgi:hypothetical protein